MIEVTEKSPGQPHGNHGLWPIVSISKLGNGHLDVTFGAGGLTTDVDVHETAVKAALGHLQAFTVECLRHDCNRAGSQSLHTHCFIQTKGIDESEAIYKARETLSETYRYYLLFPSIPKELPKC